MISSPGIVAFVSRGKPVKGGGTAGGGCRRGVLYSADEESEFGAARREVNSAVNMEFTGEQSQDVPREW